MRTIILWGSVILSMGLIASCCSTKNAGNMKSDQNALSTGPKVIIYQTKTDYSKLVPVILTDDGKSIESYPDVKDVYFNGVLAYPTPLHNGYWLDNRGITINAAFINLTYEEYSKLPKTPSPEELIKMITDRQPFVSMYSCGNSSLFKDIEKELNAALDAGNFLTFKKIK